MKTCNACHEEFPETIEYFPPNKECKNGLAPTCRICMRTYHRKWKSEHREKIRAQARKAYAEKYKDRQRNNILKRQIEKPLRHRAQIMRQGMLDRSRKNRIPFDKEFFTVDYIMSWIEQTPTCPCCKYPIDYGYKKDGGPKNSSPSIDRFTPELGYIQGNVTLLCWRCNNLKRDATISELETIIHWMKSHEVK